MLAADDTFFGSVGEASIGLKWRLSCLAHPSRLRKYRTLAASSKWPFLKTWRLESRLYKLGCPGLCSGRFRGSLADDQSCPLPQINLHKVLFSSLVLLWPVPDISSHITRSKSVDNNRSIHQWIWSSEYSMQEVPLWQDCLFAHSCSPATAYIHFQFNCGPPRQFKTPFARVSCCSVQVRWAATCTVRTQLKCGCLQDGPICAQTMS